MHVVGVLTAILHIAPREFNMSTRPLWAHQQRSIDFCTSNKCVFDQSDPGTGKTRVHIEVIRRQLRELPVGSKALVVAPKSLLQCAWGNDIAAYAPELRVSIAYAHNRREAFEQTADVYVTNTDAVNWLAAQKPKFFAQFKILIVDESTAFKHHTSQRSKNLFKIAKYFDRRHLLTGTPISNGLLNIWHQVKCIDLGERLGTSFTRFRQSVAAPIHDKGPMFPPTWVVKEGMTEVIAEMIKDISIRHVFEECLDIPPNHTNIVTFTLPPASMRAYKLMRKTQMAVIGTDIVNAVNAASATTKLLQIASGAVYNENGEIVSVDTARYELVADLAEARQHTVVFFLWRHQRDALAQAFAARGLTYAIIDGDTKDVEKIDAVRDYQAGEINVILAHPQSAAHGLTLTRGTATIWASPTSNLEWFLQGNRRIYRGGQTQRTETIVIQAEGTIETLVSQRLSAKQDEQFNLLAMVREYFYGP